MNKEANIFQIACSNVFSWRKKCLYFDLSFTEVLFWFLGPIYNRSSMFQLKCFCLHYNEVIMGAIGVSNHQPHDCLLNRLFRHRSKKTSKLRVTGLCEGNSLGTGEFPAQRASNAENVSIWWRHHVWVTSLFHYTSDTTAQYFSILFQ